MRVRNSTQLSAARMIDMFLSATEGWPHDDLGVLVRYSRGADFSGSCHYATNRIYVNLGRRNRYPYALRTHLARARSDDRSWWREVYTLEISDPYQLALFVFLHEFYHYLVRRARRNTRQKESMCDRFAARTLVDCYGARVLDPRGTPVGRRDWDFQDLDGFVSRARAGGGRRLGQPSAVGGLARLTQLDGPPSVMD